MSMMPRSPGALCLLDHTMPGLGGLDVQEALALRGIHRPIIFLTGRGTIAESVKAMKAGAVDYLTKPVDKVDLLNAIRSAEERDKTQRDVDARAARKRDAKTYNQGFVKQTNCRRYGSDRKDNQGAPHESV